MLAVANDTACALFKLKIEQGIASLKGWSFRMIYCP